MRGPADGGTVVTINGMHLDTGRDKESMIDLNIPCAITRYNATKACKTCVVYILSNV